MDRETSGRVDRWTGGQVVWWMGGLVDRWISGLVDWWTGGQVDRWTGRLRSLVWMNPAGSAVTGLRDTKVHSWTSVRPLTESSFH